MRKLRHKKVKLFDQVWPKPGGLLPECTRHPFATTSFSLGHIPAVGIFDGTKLHLPHFAGWSSWLISSKGLSLHINTSSLTKNCSFLPGGGCHICIAYHIMWKTCEHKSRGQEVNRTCERLVAHFRLANLGWDFSEPFHRKALASGKWCKQAKMSPYPKSNFGPLTCNQTN